MPDLEAERIVGMETEPRSVPDLREAYGETEISIYGVTGTVNDLLEMCPMDPAEMTVEDSNEFVARGLNEAGSEIDENHMPYVRDIIEASGTELNVTAKAEPDLFGRKAEEVDRQIDHFNKKELPRDVEDEKTLSIINKELRDNAQEAGDESHSKPAHESVKNQAADSQAEEAYTDLQMNEWLTRLEEEYAARQIKAETDPKIETDKPDTEKPDNQGAVAEEKPSESTQVLPTEAEVQYPPEPKGPPLPEVSAPAEVPQRQAIIQADDHQVETPAPDAPMPPKNDTKDLPTTSFEIHTEVPIERVAAEPDDINKILKTPEVRAEPAAHLEGVFEEEPELEIVVTETHIAMQDAEPEIVKAIDEIIIETEHLVEVQIQHLETFESDLSESEQIEEKIKDNIEEIFSLLKIEVEEEQLERITQLIIEGKIEVKDLVKKSSREDIYRESINGFSVFVSQTKSICRELTKLFRAYGDCLRGSSSQDIELYTGHK